MQTFEKLFIRENSTKLYVQLHKHFLEEEFKDEFFKNELLKATLSIGTTIARGYERSLKDGLEEFLLKAKEYVGKVKTLAYIGRDLQYFNQEECDDIIDQAGKMAGGLYKVIEKRNEKK